MFDSQYDAADDSDESSHNDRKRKIVDVVRSGHVAVMSTDVLIKTPHFITKTYQMINDSDDNIVSWTESGDKFIVKDQLRLSSECIPLYFSHSNFSSFTRQLNFYRFRKMFPSVKIGPGNENIGTMNDKHLIFYHEKFHRDHPELLPDIKRSTKTSRSSAEQEQIIEDLQQQVHTLETRLDTLSSELNVKFSTIASECDKKIASLQRSMDERTMSAERTMTERSITERSMAERSMVERSLSEYNSSAALPPTKLNRYTTEDFMRSILHMDGNNRGMDNLSAAASLPLPLSIPPPTRPLNRLGTLTLDDINRLVNHLENEGMVNDTTSSSWAPAPPNPVNRIASLSAEDILVALRSIDGLRGSERENDGKRMSY